MTDVSPAAHEIAASTTVVVAPDKFKGSLSGPEVAMHLAAGLLRTAPQLTIAQAPVGDGGEGTLDAFLAQGYEARKVTVTGSLGDPRRAIFAVKGDQAVIELAEADGLRHLDPTARQPLIATSRGFGELILEALNAGCQRLLLGLGGSANTDGGAGMMQALGVRLLDRGGGELPPGGAALSRLERIDLSGTDPRLGAVEVVVASDVNNPLLGPDGAASVYAPQKGATPDDVRVLEHGLANWAHIVRATTGRDSAGQPAAGAAGGVGFGVLSFLHPVIRPGIEVVLEVLGFDGLLDGASVVITGEGSLDRQSLRGKAPVGVANAAARRGLPTVAVAGMSQLDPEEAQAAGFVAVLALADREPDLEVCIRDAGRLLEELGPDLYRAITENVVARLI